MIPGLDLDPATECRVWGAFEAWSDQFKAKFAAGGVDYLLRDYRAVVGSLESRSCHHGPGGSLQTGEAWQRCCGIGDEYSNDLSVRDAIQIVLEHAAPQSTALLDVDVTALDDRLYALYVNRPPRAGCWWREGLPRGVSE